MEILPLHERLVKKFLKYQIKTKFDKQLALFQENPYHPSLHTELLEPRQHGIYSFRIDRKYRALFIYRADKNAVEILNITLHYQ